MHNGAQLYTIDPRRTSSAKWADGCSFLGMQAVFEPMRAAGGGSIVNISSLAGIQPFYMHSAYSAAKYGLTGLTQVAAIEYGLSGIRVNSVHPGPIDTDMLPGPGGEDRFADHPLGRAGTTRRSRSSCCSSCQMPRPTSPAPRCASTAASAPDASRCARRDPGW